MVRLSGGYFCACQNAACVPGEESGRRPLRATDSCPERHHGGTWPCVSSLHLFISETVSGFTAGDLPSHFP